MDNIPLSSCVTASGKISRSSCAISPVDRLVFFESFQLKVYPVTKSILSKAPSIFKKSFFNLMSENAAISWAAVIDTPPELPFTFKIPESVIDPNDGLSDVFKL